MKIGFGERDDKAIGSFDEVKVTIEANATSFYAQINGLVQNKPAYALREIGQNAYEAAMANPNRPADLPPFELHLPTKNSPVFRMRDYGLGMTREFLMNDYAKMYASTKRASTTAIGGWGIGRFSAFAYLINGKEVGSYVVTSIHKSKKTILVVSLNAEGQPIFRVSPESDTNDPDGVEVAFPVRLADIDRFAEEAKNIFTHFDPKPAIFPEDALKFPEYSVVMSGDGWTLYNYKSAPVSGPTVKTSVVTYPIDMDFIKNRMFTKTDCIVFDMPVGSVEPTLSRENMNYDDRTIKVLNDAFAKAEAEIMTRMQKELDDCPNLFDAKLVYNEYEKKLSSTRLGRIGYHPTWRGTRFGDYIEHENLKFMRTKNETFDRFDGAKNLYIENVSKGKIAFQTKYDRTVERLRASFNDGDIVTIVRGPASELSAFRNRTGLTEDDFVDLDAVELPKIERPKDAMRVRRVYAITNSIGRVENTSKEIDMKAGGYYVQLDMRQRGWGSRRMRHGIKTSFVDPKQGPTQLAINEHYIHEFFRICYDSGVLGKDEYVLIRGEDEALDDKKWRPLGTHVIPGLIAAIKEDEIANLTNDPVHNIDGAMRELAHLKLDDLMPKEVLDIVVRTRQAINILEKNKKDSTEVMSVRISNMFHKLEIKRLVPALEKKKDLVTAINEDALKIHQKYQCLRHLAPTRYSYYYIGSASLDNSQRTALREYFMLLHNSEMKQVA